MLVRGATGTPAARPQSMLAHLVVAALVAFESRALPPPERDGGPGLHAMIAARRSHRTFGPRAIEDRELGQLLWAAQGAVDGHRTAPSAGALYPLHIRVIDASGSWRYEPAKHALVHEATNSLRASLCTAALGQESVCEAPLTLVISAAFAVSAKKYGALGERFATLEAGHAAQNILLEATALRLAATPVGSFDATELRNAIELPADETPLYLIPIGAPP
jgi:SagB-type dehydrogenase family enzyme